MTKYDYDIGVIGGGAAGLTVASGAAQLGAKTLLVEKETRLGGDCLHYGCVPSKTLIRSAQVCHLIKNAPHYGLPAVEVPVVEFSAIARRIRSVIETIQAHDSPERFCGLGAQVEFGSPRFSDEHVIELDGRRFSAQKWVIATGSSASRPPISGLGQTPHLTNREIFSLEQLPQSMIVLGAGPIGIEMAQAFSRLGTRVSVVDRAEQILIKEDADMAGELMGLLTAEGVQLHLSAAIQSVRDLGAEKEVMIRNAEGQTETLRAEVILVAMGRKPNIEELGLERIGVALQPGGLQVDSRLRTSQKHIYGAGDVIGGYQFTHAAGYEGGIVVSNAVFHLPRKADYTLMPWATYTDPELASIGLNEKSAAASGIEVDVWSEPFRNNDRALAESTGPGRIKLLVDRKEKPVGVQILGSHAGDLIAEWVAALSGRIKTATLAAAVHPYPTLGEINKKVTGALFAPKIFSDKVRKGLKLFFNLKGRACTLPG